MHLNDANHTPDLNTPGSARTRRTRARRLGLPTAAVAGVLTAALVGSGFSGSTTSAAPAEGSAPEGVSVLAAGAGTLSAVSTKSASSKAAAKSAKAKRAAKLMAKKKAAKKRKVKMTRLAKKAPRKAAKKMLSNRGYGARQKRCLIKLWNKESNFRWNAANPSSSAYGIPQALPGRKMASHGSDWRTNPVTQMQWGLRYIKDRHGSPCGAWKHSQRRGWY